MDFKEPRSEISEAIDAGQDTNDVTHEIVGIVENRLEIQALGKRIAQQSKYPKLDECPESLYRPRA